MGLASWGRACPLPGVSQQAALIHESPGLASCGTQPGKQIGRGSTLTSLSLYPFGQIQTPKTQLQPRVPTGSAAAHGWK